MKGTMRGNHQEHRYKALVVCEFAGFGDCPFGEERMSLVLAKLESAYEDNGLGS